MSSDDPLRHLLANLAARAPAGLAFPDADRPWEATDHPLATEIVAALSGGAASLPVMTQGRATWVTFAPDFAALREAIEDLRAAIIPSMAWELPPGLITPLTAQGALAQTVLAASPQGYFRWECRPPAVCEVANRLGLLRHLSAARPPREGSPIRSLAELHQRFLVALAIGDFEGAEAAVDAIDAHQLDTAVNTLAMRVRLWETFGRYEDIVRSSHLENLLTARVPRPVVEAVVRAHHAVHLLPSEGNQSVDQTGEVYAARLHSLLGPAIARIGKTADPVLQRMRNYWAQTVGEENPGQAAPHDGGEASNNFVDQSLTSSGHLQCWEDFVPALRADNFSGADAFLDEISLIGKENTSAVAVSCANALLECFTDVDIADHPARARAAERALLAVIDDRVCNPNFPERTSLPLYVSLLDCWSLARGKSAHGADGQFLLAIAEAVLVLDSGREQLVAEMVRAWWRARPIRARLSWLLEALDMLTDFSVPPDMVDLWYAGAELASAEGPALSTGERRLWSRLGARFGVTAHAIEAILGAPPPLVTADPLRNALLQRVAIVSLQERAAEIAAQEIRQRSGAQVQLVTEHVAGAATRAAADADVVLMVWSASKHAVYRAFDKVRDRLEYVQGTGATSIVLALERWVARGRAF
jgi:hypothetical protein